MELRTKNCPLADSVQGRRFPESTERILLVEHQEEAKMFRLFSNHQLKKATEADISNDVKEERRSKKGDKRGIKFYLSNRRRSPSPPPPPPPGGGRFFSSLSHCRSLRRCKRRGEGEGGDVRVRHLLPLFALRLAVEKDL